MYLKAKEKIWKLKYIYIYFTMQKYNVKKSLDKKETKKILQDIIITL